MSVRSVIDDKEVILTKPDLHEILQLPNPSYFANAAEFDVEASNDEICRDIMELGYSERLKKNKIIQAHISSGTMADSIYGS